MPWIILATDRTEFGADIKAVAGRRGPDGDLILCDRISSARGFTYESEARTEAAKLQPKNPSLLLTPFRL